MAKFRQCRAQIDSCGRFTDAAFLVRKRNNSHNEDRQMMLPAGLNGN
jgi:hypothetical protein